MRRMRTAAAGALLLSVAGCIPAYVVPEPLDRQVDRSVSFSHLKQDAERYKGASVVLGGEVLNARILPEGTQIEVLHLPLDASDRPVGAYEYSEGRYLLIDPERRDPIVLQRRLITVVGEVIGTKVQKVDEADYVFPYLSARFIRVWRGPNDYATDAGYPYSYPYYPYYAPYYYPYGPYYPYYYADPFFWSGSFYYYDYYDHRGYSHDGPSQRRFNPPAGGGPPPSPSPGWGGGGSGGGGGGRIFK